ncbi:MAG: MGMT family protein [Candidatus Omnitrophica bacterium]|nr:MGMT family protein [Candidatus Omnitrophota bacterium]
MTNFEKRVYKTVVKIPLGQVRTYKWVAQKIGHPKAYRAVGQALKKNPYPLIVPCHRVVSSSSDIGGFAWGRKNKKLLLDLERQIRKLMI